MHASQVGRTRPRVRAAGLEASKKWIGESILLQRKMVAAYVAEHGPIVTIPFQTFSDYGDDVTYDLLNKRATVQEWYTARTEGELIENDDAFELDEGEETDEDSGETNKA